MVQLSGAYVLRRAWAAGRPLAVCAFLFLAIWLGAAVCEAEDLTTIHFSDTNAPLVVSNAVQFRALSGQDYFDSREFHLNGVVTTVDAKRSLLVVQDATGAVALHFTPSASELEAGQMVSLDGTNFSPYVMGFPAYPYQPTDRDIRKTFEAPSDLGEYYLTRMRGFVHPPVTGDYTFWIASDNSSELWLSVNESPSQVRRLAFIPRFGWVNPREWSRLPSQKSDPVRLEGGKSYYIEAFQEQATEADHLSVAWQGPGIEQSVIGEAYLTPCEVKGLPFGEPGTHGILREHWSNYWSGDLGIVAGPKTFAGALSVESLRVTINGTGALPKPNHVALSEELPVGDAFRWVETQGRVTFAGVGGGEGVLELFDGEASIQVRAAHFPAALAHGIVDAPVQITGVCEGVYDKDGVMVPGVIWAPLESNIVLLNRALTNGNDLPNDKRLVTTPASAGNLMAGFYVTHGVVTFSDIVFGKEYLFVQEDNAGVFVSLKDRHFDHHLEVGEWVEVGGHFEGEKDIPSISPLVISDLGWRALPIPVPQPAQTHASDEGKWTEVEGVVHSLDSNGTISMMGKGGAINVWIGKESSNNLARLVDTRVRARGVLSQTIIDGPLLLSPDRRFLEVEDEAPVDSFRVPIRSIGSINTDMLDYSSGHRTKIAGEVIYQDAQSFVIEDASGGMRIEPAPKPAIKLGDAVEVVGFPPANGRTRVMTEALVRATHLPESFEARELDFGAPLARQSGTLVEVSADVVAQKTNGPAQVLELQEGQRVFTASLETDSGSLPVIASGSRVRITGVADNEATVLPASKGGAGKVSLDSLNIWLRSPGDIIVLHGPPWWTLKRTVALVGTLCAVLIGASLWIHLLHWRLEHQQAARLVFSKQILSNQESERRRIAANLHDALGQNLLVIANQAQMAMQSAANEPALQQRLGEISSVAVQAIEEVRQITLDLRPYHLDRLGLTEAIRATVTRASENTTIQFASHIDEVDGVFDKESEIHVYRIVQEAINNVLKHSAATEAAVVIKKQPESVSLSVRDNGRGFDSESEKPPVANGSGYGLNGIKERVRILGGTLTIEAYPGAGTSLSVQVPVHHHETIS